MLDKDKRRGERRFIAQKKSRHRYQDVADLFTGIDAQALETLLGRLRDSHIGCGCSICKPWKFGLGDALPFRDRRKL